MPTLLGHLCYSLRQLVKAPSFSIAVILSLALGIGDMVAVFSLTDAILLRPLQFGNESRVVQIWERRPGYSIANDPAVPGNFAYWRSRNHVFDEVGAVGNTILSITGDGRPQQVEASQITANLLPVLGVKPLLGRNFRPDEDRPSANHVALISATLWQSRYGSDPHIIGRTIRLDGVPYSVAGVMPSGFSFYQRSEVWIPLALSPAFPADRGDHFLLVFGLLRANTNIQAAGRDLWQFQSGCNWNIPAPTLAS